MSELPVDAILPELRATLAAQTRAVLQAPPGAGKTTRVPLALLDAPWLDGRKILMLEPRRLAARSSARFMASLLGEPVGERVGYRTHLDSRVGPRTRIEVVTEGVLTRLLQADGSLPGIGLVIFDEFHERSLNADLGLALSLETQAALREDLRLLVMSATLETEAVSALLGGAPVLASQGRSYPVEVRYAERRPEQLLPAVVAAVRRALAEHAGSLLVFLPGQGEIRRAAALLGEAGLPAGVELAPLYGELEGEAQDRAIRPAPKGRRKVVLATSIAETSLTIEGIAVVIDAGLARVPRFDPRSGMTRLETVRCSQAASEQRRGRAGRLGPGVCYRLWSEHEQGQLPVRTAPEILNADLAPLALELAEWGVTDPADLAWLDAPPSAAYGQARELLAGLGALDTRGRITPHGRALAELPLHPRLAHMVLAGRERGLGGLACELAALLSERDLLRRGEGPREADLRLRLEALWALEDERERAALAAQGYHIDQGTVRRCAETARRWQRRLGVAPGPRAPEHAGELLALAYPDRVGQRRAGEGARYLLANGRGAFLPEVEPLAMAEFLVAADLDAGQREARIFLAAPLERSELEALFAERIETRERVGWDTRQEQVIAVRERRLGALTLREEPLPRPSPEGLTAALIQGIRDLGLEALPWTRELREWQQRVSFLRGLDTAEGRESAWPDVSDAALLAGLEDWLGPYLGGLTRRAHLARVDLRAALTGLLGWEQTRALDALAPTHLTVPSGSRVRLDYGPEGPVLAVRLQEMFGLTDTPRIAGGRVPVLLHLLSPAQRPMQVTRDLASFWAGAYHEVKKDLRGRYPKHAWPDDPLAAAPLRGTRRPTGDGRR